MLEMQAGNQKNSAKKIYTKNEINAPFSNPMGDYTLLMRGDDSFDFSALLCRRGSAGEFSLFIYVPSNEANNVGKVDDNFIQKYLTNIRNPVLMKVEDIPEVEKYCFQEKQCQFIVTGDFNKDGIVEHAFVGKYNGAFQNQSIFVAIISMRNNLPHTEFLLLLENEHDRAFIKVERGKDVCINGIEKKYDVLLVTLEMNSGNIFAVAWDGKQYIQKDFFYPKTNEKCPNK